WEVNVNKNGDPIYQHFYNAVQPEKLMFNAYPFHTDTLPGHGFKSLHLKMQQSHNLQPGFYYVPQSFGRLNSQGQVWGWYKPSSAELKASTMLALAHGSKGIIFSDYYKYWFSRGGGGWIDGIVDSLGNPSQLWDVIKDNLTPRLAGTFGKTLLRLDYSGNYFQLKYFAPTDDPPLPAIYNYLTLGYYQSVNDMNWHAGFFERPNHPEDKYFFLVNILTTAECTTHVKLTPPVPGFNNYRFRDVEGSFDETFTTQIIKQLTHPAGEGRLYEVAPVVKYGGRLIYSETTSGTQTLHDVMTIDNNTTLTINGTYNCEADIIIKNGNIVTSNGGTVNFLNGSKLIIEGSAFINGNASNNLVLNFSSSTGENGIVVNESGAYT